MRLRKIIAGCMLCLLAGAGFQFAAAAQPVSTDTAGRRWTIVGEAATDTDLSGAACTRDGRCLLVSDEKRRAWFFTLDQRDPTKPKIVIGDPVKLKPAEGDGEADVEAAAFDGDRYYAIGSHGVSRYKGEFQASRYSTYRIDADGSVTASPALTGMIAIVPGIRQHFCTGTSTGCQSLQVGGANIEGLAAKNGKLYVGFRSPAPGGRGFILRVAETAVFGHTDPGLTVFRLELGKDTKGRDLGIRDIAAASDGFLILAGPSLPEGDDAVGSGRVLHWREGEERPSLLRDIPVTDKGVKPEVLLLLNENEAAYRVLIMSDGIAGGSPTEYELRKR